MTADLRPGDRVLRGLVYRRIPNTVLPYDYKERKPGKLAFRPDRGEYGISVFLADLLTGPQDVIRGLDGYGVCEFRAEHFHDEVARLRGSRDNDFDEDVPITFEPNEYPVVGHAHCYIEPVPGILQKALYKRLARMTDGYHPGPPVAGRTRD